VASWLWLCCVIEPSFVSRLAPYVIISHVLSPLCGSAALAGGGRAAVLFLYYCTLHLASGLVAVALLRHRAVVSFVSRLAPYIISRVLFLSALRQRGGLAGGGGLALALAEPP
jgi:hypothetical protein